MHNQNKLTFEEVLSPGSEGFDLGQKHFLVSEEKNLLPRQCFGNTVCWFSARSLL